MKLPIFSLLASFSLVGATEEKIHLRSLQQNRGGRRGGGDQQQNAGGGDRPQRNGGDGQAPRQGGDQGGSGNPPPEGTTGNRTDGQTTPTQGGNENPPTQGGTSTGEGNPSPNGGNPPPTQVDGDLNIRFNKIPFPGGAPSGFFPLEATDYPVRGETADMLQTQSRGASVVLADDFELHKEQPGDYIQAIGGLPSMPNTDPNHEFWAELQEVVDMQVARKNNVNPSSIFRLPNLWEGYSIARVADAVHDEYPGFHQAELMKQFWSEGVSLDYNIVPFRSNLDFIGLQVRMAALNTWAIGVVSAPNFCLKWSAGRPRPEEVVYKIATSELTQMDGVPDNLVNQIELMGLASAEDFTAYEEGSPVHPSWPAMHSAASSASLWLAVLLDLSPDQYCEALRVDYAVSYARTIAGVHYPTDNIAGLNMGTEVMRNHLADHMAETYGSDRTAVQNKLNRLAFDWANFNPTDCSTTGSAF